MEITSVIIKPKLTEKTQKMKSLTKPKMVFFVNPNANKKQIATAFKFLFGIWPDSISVVLKKPSPTRFMNKTKNNYSKRSKIAYITVKNDDLDSLKPKEPEAQPIETEK